MNPSKDDLFDPLVLDAMLDAVAAENPPPSLRAKLMQRVRDEAPAGPACTIRDAERWQSLTTDVEFKLLNVDAEVGRKTFILRAQPGARMPAHRHSGYEACLVMQGELFLGAIALQAGDFHAVHENTEHGEAFTPHGVTVFLSTPIADYPGVKP